MENEKKYQFILRNCNEGEGADIQQYPEESFSFGVQGDSHPANGDRVNYPLSLPHHCKQGVLSGELQPLILTSVICMWG